MSVTDVRRVVGDRTPSKISQYVSDDQRYMTLAVGTGLQSTCDRRLEFKDGRLLHALLRHGDNGRRPEDAPPDW
jgi:hypothetical protein